MNLDRVLGLVSLYDEVTGRIPGRPSVREAELLRAAVVLLHATLENLMRGLAGLRLPTGSPETLARIPFAGGDGRRTTLTLGDLAAYRGWSVDEILVESTAAYLDRRSYNDTNDLVGGLREVGLSSTLLEPHAAQLQGLMKRRHHIVHRLDHNELPGRGHHVARSIGRAAVEEWTGNVRGFGMALLDRLAREAEGPA